MAQPYPGKKIGWGRALWTYLTDENELRHFIKFAAGFEVASFIDEWLDWVPGLNAITIGDDFVVPVIFGIFSFFRIIYIRSTHYAVA